MSLKRMSFVVLSLIGSLLTFSSAYSSAIMGTTSAGNEILTLPTPGTNLPTPTINIVGGLPVGAQPHGVGFFGTDSALVSDFSNGRVYVVTVSTNTLVDTINTAPTYDGTGSIAISPLLTHALALGGSTTLAVIQAPFTAASAISTVALSGTIAGYQTEAIVFNSAGRAFVYTTTGIDVLDSPYTSVAFSIPVAGNGSSGSIAITPDGNTLLVTKLTGGGVDIFQAPFSAASTSVNLPITGSAGLDGIVVAPNGNTALVVDAFASQIVAIQAPFSAASVVESIPLPGGIGTFEDIDIDNTSSLAIATGNSTTQPALFIQSPFTAAGATTFSVTVPNGGRGNGAVRFLPAALSAAFNIVKTGTATVDQGGLITYTITYGNNGSADATNVVIRDTIPANTSFVSATNGGAVNGNEVVWNIGTVGIGVQNQTVQFTVQANAVQGSTITNTTYSVTADGIPAVAGTVPVVTTVNVTTVVQPVPTLSEWMMMVLATLLLGVAALRLRQS